MGCSESNRKEDLNEEEDLVAEERKLNYWDIDANRIDIIFKRYSISAKMLGTQFLAACTELNVNLRSYGPSNTAITKFYNSFKITERHFNQTRLSTLGVLLGKGSPKEKAQVLFKIYDIVKDNTLDEQEIKVMIEGITEISLIIIPTYAVNMIINEEKKREMVKYTKKLEMVRDTLIRFYEIFFFSGKKTKISLDEFLEMFSRSDIAALTSSTLLREMAMREYGKVIAPAPLVKDFILETNRKTL